MALIRAGHGRVYEYGYSMFQSAQEEYAHDEQRQIVNMAYAQRMSRQPDEKWKEFVKSSEKRVDPAPKPKKKTMTAEDHKRVIRALRGH